MIDIKTHWSTISETGQANN